MIDYFDEDRPVGETAKIYFILQSTFSFEKAAKYDREFLNKILNKSEISEDDKACIAMMLMWYINHLKESYAISKGFEKYLLSAYGKEWFQNVVSGWLRRVGANMARILNCPELMPDGVFFVKGDDLL